jgi:hypothetical protein
MGSQHTVIDNIVYNLISIEYHALQGAETYAKYLEDAKAQGHQDVAEFISQVHEEDNRRALRAHQLIIQLTKDSGIA